MPIASHGKSPPGNAARRRPVAAHPGEERRQPRHRRFGQPAIRRELAAEHRQEGRFTGGRVQLQHVVARRVLRLAGTVVQQRTHAGVAPDDVRGIDRPAQIGADRAAQIRLLLRRARHLGRIAVEILVGGADQGEIVLDTEWRSRRARRRSGRCSSGRARTAEARRCGCPSPAGRASAQRRPRHRPAPATHTARRHSPAHAHAPRRRLPASAATCHPLRARPMQRVRVRISAPRAAASRAFSTTRRESSTQQSEYSKPRAYSGRSGAPAGSRRRSTARVGGRIWRPPRWSYSEQPEPDQPPRPQPGMVRQHEAQRPDDVRRRSQQHLALGQRFAHQAEGVVLEIAQPAMDQLGRGRRRAAGQIALLHQQHRQSPSGRVAGNAAAVHAAADDGEVEHLTPNGIQGWTNSPDLPPALWVRRTASMRMPRSTDLHMS